MPLKTSTPVAESADPWSVPASVVTCGAPGGDEPGAIRWAFTAGATIAAAGTTSRVSQRRSGRNMTEVSMGEGNGGTERAMVERR